MTSGALKTLFLPFEREILPEPTGDMKVLFLGAEPDSLLVPQWKKALTCVQPSRPDFLALEKAGFNVVPRLDTALRFDHALILISKHKGRNEGWFADALAQVSPGGTIVISGDKKLGIDGFRKWVERSFPTLDRLSKNHAVAFWLERPANLADAAISSLRPASIQFSGFETMPGMFSHGAVDKGSALLAGYFAGRISGRVADFGAGWGYLATECLKHPQKLVSLDLFEADYEALEVAKRYLAGHPSVPVGFYWSDLLSEAVTGIYDTVVMNPPFHAGRAADAGLGQGFIAAAARRLKPGGRLLMVANRQMPYEASLKAVFKAVDILVIADGFKVIEARK
ncbi:MAG: methyltransferase [Phyllobacterium sp.]